MKGCRVTALVCLLEAAALKHSCVCFSVGFPPACFIPVSMVSRQTSDSPPPRLPTASAVVSFGRKLRKACSESYTYAFPATSQVHFGNEVSWHMSPRYTFLSAHICIHVVWGDKRRFFLLHEKGCEWRPACKSDSTVSNYYAWAWKLIKDANSKDAKHKLKKCGIHRQLRQSFLVS